MTPKNPTDSRHQRRVVGRRLLIKTLGLGAAGLALGGGAAWATTRLEDAAVADAAIGELKSQLAAATESNAALRFSASGFQTQLAELQSQLALASSQNGQLASALSTAQAESAGLKTQLATTQSQLSTTTERLSRSTELISLYDQLEAVGLDGVAQQGLNAAAGGLATVVGLAPLASDGLNLARNLLAGFEQTLPGFQSTMNWLGEQIVNLKVNIYSVEAAAQQTINSALTGAATVFGGFAKFVLDHLPFNIGKNVQATLSATQNLLAGLPPLLAGAEDKILVQISQHIGEGDKSWKRTLVNPMRERALPPADQLLSAVSQADAAFKTSLNDPVQTAISHRSSVRQAIAAFRAAHNL